MSGPWKPGTGIALNWYSSLWGPGPPSRTVSQACLWSRRAASLPPGSLPHHSPKGVPTTQTAHDKVCLAHMQLPAEGCWWCCRESSKGPGEAASMPLSSLHPEPRANSARVLRSGPAQPAADRTAGKTQEREHGSLMSSVPVYCILDFCCSYFNNLKSELIKFGTHPESYCLHKISHSFSSLQSSKGRRWQLTK